MMNGSSSSMAELVDTLKSTAGVGIEQFWAAEDPTLLMVNSHKKLVS
jgi:hypothetical protein